MEALWERWIWNWSLRTREVDRAGQAVSGSLIPEVFLDCSMLQSWDLHFTAIPWNEQELYGKDREQVTLHRKQVANVEDGKIINRRCILLEQVMSAVYEFDFNSE